MSFDLASQGSYFGVNFLNFHFWTLFNGKKNHKNIAFLTFFGGVFFIFIVGPDPEEGLIFSFLFSGVLFGGIPS